ncbi:Gfo/Idh/MocA family oxidoreductase [soil metagenome]
MDNIRVGIVGKRGASAVQGLRAVEGVEVEAFCEIDPSALASQLKEHGVEKGFLRFEEMLDHVDAVAIGSPMQLHVPQAILALEAGKHVLSEVTAAVSLEECWRLLDAVRASGKTYMLAENYCYFEENVLIREMVRKGLFGDIYFAEGEYIHDVRFLHHNADGSPTWRYYWQVGTPGNTYITHELGPPMQWMRAQDPDDRIETVACLGTGVHTDPEHPHDDTCLTLVKLKSGKLLKMRIDMMSNTPGMSYYSLQGVLGTYESGRGGGVGSRIWTGPNKSVAWGDSHREWRPVADYLEHLPADYKVHAEAAGQAGHGGGDYHTARIFAQSIRDGSPPDIDVYDALAWTATGLCSQISIASGGVPIRVPDFRDPSQRPITLDAPAVRP